MQVGYYVTLSDAEEVGQNRHGGQPEAAFL